MFAIIKTGGKQYKVAKGDKLDVEKIDQKEGSTIEITKVLLVNDENGIKIGTPLVEGAVVTAKVAQHYKGEKIIIFQMKSKNRFEKTRGHRQTITTLEITDIKISKTAHVEKKTEKVEEKPVKKEVKKAKVAAKKPAAKAKKA